jgi:hypothetical protein
MSMDSVPIPEPRGNELRLFEISFTQWGPPLTLLAKDYGQAVALAQCRVRERTDVGGMIVRDATEEWQSASTELREHTNAALRTGMPGPISYDLENGWLRSAADL